MEVGESGRCDARRVESTSRIRNAQNVWLKLLIKLYYNKKYFHFTSTGKLWNSLPASVFPSSYELNTFKERSINYWDTIPTHLAVFWFSHLVFFVTSPAVCMVWHWSRLFFVLLVRAFDVKTSASASASARMSYFDIRIRICIRILAETDIRIHICIRKMTSAYTSAPADVWNSTSDTSLVHNPLWVQINAPWISP